MKKNIKEDLKLMNLINLEETPQEEEIVIPAVVEIEKPVKNTKRTSKAEEHKTKYLFSMNTNEYDKLRAVATITGENINEIICKSIIEYFEKPENAEIMKSAEVLLKAIRKHKN